MLKYELKETRSDVRLVMDRELVFNPHPKYLKEHILENGMPSSKGLYDQFIRLFIFLNTMRKQKILENDC